MSILIGTGPVSENMSLGLEFGNGGMEDQLIRFQVLGRFPELRLMETQCPRHNWKGEEGNAV